MSGGQFDLTGVDAALNNPRASIWGNQFQSTWRHLTANVNFWPTPQVIVANPDLFNSLAQSQQEALTGAASATLDYALRVTADSDPEAMTKLCAGGTTLDVATDAQLAELESTVRPVVDRLRADPAKAAVLDEIEALKFDVAAPPNTLSCDSPSSAQGASRSVSLMGRTPGPSRSGTSGAMERKLGSRKSESTSPTPPTPRAKRSGWCSPAASSQSTTLTPKPVSPPRSRNLHDLPRPDQAFRAGRDRGELFLQRRRIAVQRLHLSQLRRLLWLRGRFWFRPPALGETGMTGPPLR